MKTKIEIIIEPGADRKEVAEILRSWVEEALGDNGSYSLHDEDLPVYCRLTIYNPEGQKTLPINDEANKEAGFPPQKPVAAWDDGDPEYLPFYRTECHKILGGEHEGELEWEQ